MTERVPLGWRVPEAVMDRFTDYVAEKHGATDGYLRFEIECAMREILDEDDDLVEAEQLLRNYLDLHGLSSSTDLVSTGRYRGQDTTKVMNRINADLKESFAIFADKHDAGYGRLLAGALDIHADGGRARRVRDCAAQVVGGDSAAGTTGDTTASLKESASDSTAASDTTDPLKESQLSSSTSSGITADTTNADAEADDVVDVDANHVLEIVEGLPDDLTENIIPKKVLDPAITEVVGNGDAEVLDAYRDAVLEQVNAHKHPHNDERANPAYITEAYRKRHRFYADMDRDECEVALSRFLAADTAEHETLIRPYTYKEVQGVFKRWAGGGSPSHQFAYELMDAVGDLPGFEYGEFHGQQQIRVNLAEVPSSVRTFIREESGWDDTLDSLDVDARIENYGSGSPPDQENAADD